MLRFQGAEAWALKNDCNGIFEDTIAASEWGAQQHLNRAEYSDPEVGCYAVPVRIYEEPVERHPHRRWYDRQMHGAPANG